MESDSRALGKEIMLMKSSVKLKILLVFCNNLLKMLETRYVEVVYRVFSVVVPHVSIRFSVFT